MFIQKREGLTLEPTIDRHELAYKRRCFLCKFKGTWLFKLQKPVSAFWVKNMGVCCKGAHSTKKKYPDFP
jgi:hypothetical protein